MKNSAYLSFFIIISFLAHCKSGDGENTEASGGSSVSGTAQWLQLPTPASGTITFSNVATDSSGNVYVVGTQTGTGAHQYAAGVTATGTATGSNAVLVKYNSAGAAQWARSTTAGTGGSSFQGVAVDSSGNVFAVGSQSGNTSTSYAAGVTATGTYNLGNNVVIVKYNSSGAAQWARTVTAGTNASSFTAAAADSTGNVYAVGSQSQNGVFTYAAGVSATGSASAATNAVIVKYDTNGTAQWAKTVSAGNNNSVFNGVGVDSSGNAYVAGSQSTNASYTYDTGVTATGVSVSGLNLVVVKYNSAGTGQWARVATAGSNQSNANAIAVDSGGNSYVAGYQIGNTAFTYGVGVSATASASGAMNSLLVKYDNSGTAQWARTVTTGAFESRFFAVAIDGTGKIMAGGNKLSENSFAFGNGITVTGTSFNYNMTLVQYDSSGNAQWGRSVTSGSNNSRINGIAADSSGNIYGIGFQNGTGTYAYGSGISAAGPLSGDNALIVKYR